MEDQRKTFDLELICVIANFGAGSKVLHIAKQNGISGGTVFFGEGTVKSRILEFLALSEVRKEIVLMLSDSETADRALKALDRELKLHKPNHGIAFTMPVCGVVGSQRYSCSHSAEERGAEQYMYQAITVIVDRGKAEDVMDAAVAAGSKGGTIINARGSGIHETSRVFMMDIEPEKEIVLIVARRDRVDDIVESIDRKMQLEEPGNGILYVQDVKKTYGIYDE